MAASGGHRRGRDPAKRGGPAASPSPPPMRCAWVATPCGRAGMLADMGAKTLRIWSSARCEGTYTTSGDRMRRRSPESEPERELRMKGTESRQHQVMIGAAFAVGRYAVT
jgi:hypothetical protein